MHYRSDGPVLSGRECLTVFQQQGGRGDGEHRLHSLPEHPADDQGGLGAIPMETVPSECSHANNLSGRGAFQTPHYVPRLYTYSYLACV